MSKLTVWLLLLISMSQVYGACFAGEDPHYLEYKRADGSSEYYGDLSGNRITREQYIELGKQQIQAMQNRAVEFGAVSQIAAQTYGDDADKVAAIQKQGTDDAVAELEKSKQEFVERIQKHESKPTFQKAMTSYEAPENFPASKNHAQ